MTACPSSGWLPVGRRPCGRGAKRHVAGLPPDGEPAPPDGALPASAAAEIGASPFGIYVHVPFCATRCGYCDFNTYTADEPGGAGRESYPGLAIAEIRLARRVLGDAAPGGQTGFFGGGTPTLLAPSRPAATPRAVAPRFRLVP